MSKKIIGQTNFTSGELSPELWGRSDLDRYKSGLKECRNAVISPRGSVKRRNGFKYINEVKDSDTSVRLIKFQYTQTYAYIIELGDEYMRFYRDGEVIGDPYEVVSPFTEDELWEITYVQYANTIYFAHSNHAPQQLIWTSDEEWELSEIDFYPPPLKEQGYIPSSATLTFAAITGSDITFTSSVDIFLEGDIGRQIHNLTGDGVASITSITDAQNCVCEILEDFPSLAPLAPGDWKIDLSPIAKLSFEGVSQGSITKVRSKYIDSARGDATAITNITNASPAAVSSASHGLLRGDKCIITGVLGMTMVNDRIYTAGDISTNAFGLHNPDTYANIDSSSFAAYTSGGVVRKVLEDVEMDVFRSEDVGTYIVANDGVGYIIKYNDARSIDLEIQKDFSTVNDTSAWSQETPAWSSTLGYPRCVTMHQQRLWFASNSDAPQKIWGSETAIFDGMGRGSEDTGALDLDISSPQVNQINWMASLGPALIVGNLGNEMTVTSGSSSAPITSSNATLDTASQEGSNIQQPVLFGNELLFVNRSGQKILSFAYNFDSDNYKPFDLTFLSQHLTSSGVKEISTATDPDRNIYAVLNDGTMMVGTYLKDQQVLGWSLWDTDGYFESVETISTGTHDEVWCVVKRTINGATKRYIERLDYSDGTDRVDGFSDCYAIYSQPKTITNIQQSSPCVVTSAAHGLSNGTVIKIVDVVGMIELNNKSYTVANATTDTFELSGVNSISYTAYVSGGEAHDLIGTVSSLDHLEGKTVQVKVDGATHPDATISSGAITLQAQHYDVTIGLPYEFKVTLLPQSFDVGMGNQISQPVRWVTPILRVYKSAIPTIQGEYTPARAGDDEMDSAVPLYTGDLKYGSFTWNDNSSISITCTLPYPVVLLGIVGSVDSGQF